ncbi:unnamed protein product [Mytilus coruscus]|uniref:Uncharacterized protein n=1 Tax=Mytilus coruscus TaxID=42192 RepID=A0A6J8CIV3_MYTCO|nr:unnamed protein product [Mytilus coruscus]
MPGDSNQKGVKTVQTMLAAKKPGAKEPSQEKPPKQNKRTHSSVADESLECTDSMTSIQSTLSEIKKALQVTVTKDDLNNENLRERVRAKDESIEKLEEQVSENNNRAFEAIKLGNYNEQYSRKRNIRMLNYPERPNEVLRDEFVNMENKVLKVDIKPDDVQAIHRIPGKEGYIKPVIVKVSNTELKIKIMRQKRGLKNDIKFHDDITQRNLGLMTRIKNGEHFENVWFYNCNVYAKQKDGSRIRFDLFDNIEQKLKKQKQKRSSDIHFFI